MTVQLRGIRAIVFDLDDTLYAERDFARSGFDAVSRWLRERFPCPSDPVLRMRELFETGDRRRIFDQLLAELRCPRPSEFLSGMIECYRNHVPGIGLAPDSRRALERWAGRYFLGLISDGPLIMQQRKVEALNLSRWIDLIILTDQWGQEFWKPHPRAFERIERESGHRGSTCVYIGDNPAKDFITPNVRGWRSIRIRRGNGAYDDVPSPPGGCEQFQVQSLDDIDIR